MSRRNRKKVEDDGSRYGCSYTQDEEMENLRLQLQRLEHRLQMKDDTLDELRRRSY